VRTRVYRRTSADIWLGDMRHCWAHGRRGGNARRLAQRERERAERNDQRPQIACPLPDAPWLPVMDTILEVVAAAPPARKVKRDIDETATRPRRMAIPRMHAFSGDDDEPDNTLPPPEQWVLSKMTDIELSEEIERHIDFIEINDENEERSVHLPMSFVRLPAAQ